MMGTFLPTITEEQAKQQAKIFKALSDPVRLVILNLLKMHEGRMAVMDIVDNSNHRQSSISHHLAVLQNAGLIDCEKRGLYVFYRVRGETVAQAQGALREVTV